MDNCDYEKTKKEKQEKASLVSKEIIDWLADAYNTKLRHQMRSQLTKMIKKHL